MTHAAPRDLQPRAVCHRCGGIKGGPFVPCKACTFTPTGEERAVAWLFSEDYLSSDELVYAAERVRRGDRPDPSTALKARAREGMGAKPVPLSEAARAPLKGAEIAWLTGANLLLTPLAGVAVWAGLRDERPAAARQALVCTLPAAMGMGALWAAVMLA